MIFVKNKSENIKLELEFTRELPISLYYVWFEGHLYANKTLLKLPVAPAKQVFAVYDNGIAEVYTQKDNIEKLKKAVGKLSNEKIENILTSYFLSFCELKENYQLIKKASFTKELVGKFVITFIIGDMPENPFQNEAFKLREKTEQLFPLILNSLKSIAKDKENFDYYTYTELIKNKKISKNILLQRNKCQLFKNKIVPNLNSDQIIQDKVNDNDSELVQGKVAFPGHVKGRVRLVLSKNNLNTIQDDEILVTNMTTPDFVPALKKVAAFITDEGGITSHAAIIAREMKKPCIIGTKIATKVLKDGDLVEVDANNGVIRVLKKG